MRIPVRVLLQCPIDNFIVDFYCASHKLVIEIDGGIHSTIHAKKYDDFRTGVLEGYGLRVIRFTNSSDEIVFNQNKTSPRYCATSPWWRGLIIYNQRFLMEFILFE